MPHAMSTDTNFYDLTIIPSNVNSISLPSYPTVQYQASISDEV